MRVLGLVCFTVQAFGAWIDLGSATQLSSVSPQNCTNTGSPSYCNGVTFAYADNFAALMTAWSTCTARTKAGSEQMLCFGGGHVATFNNAVYAVNVAAATVTALTVPSIPTGSGSPVTTANITCASPNADGTPLSMHSYQQLVYLPVADKMFFWADGAGNYCATSGTRHVWWFDPDVHTWTDKMPGGFDVTTGGDAAFAFCVLDPTTAHETVICEWGGNDMLLRYDATDNTWERLTLNGSFGYPNAVTMAIDPVRQVLIIMGATTDVSGVQKVIKVDISNSMYTATDITGSLVGCSALNTPYPGIDYDSRAHTLVAYPGTGNTVYAFNPDTATCTAITTSGGPTAVNGNSTLGRWAYFPTLNKHVNLATVTTNAFTFQFNGGSVLGGKITLGGKVSQ